ncbi:MAG: TOBE domain-containing protein, partial [FCB group bacterium]|nr:TOBE domain-containing protein [FCB group bacterium]
RNEIKKLHQSLKSTMMYVTHDQVEAMTMGDRIVVMKNGYLMQSDAPLEIYKKPVNRFVASFIGSPSMNFLEAKVVIDGNLSLGGENFSLKYAQADYSKLEAYNGKQVILGVRPEHLSLNQSGKGLEAKLEISELMGSESYLHALLGTVELVARVSAGEILTPGKTIHLHPDFEHLHFFDAQTELRIN